MLSLVPVLTSLVQPGRVQPWLRPQLIRRLALIPLRPRGVRNTIEFILSVHPSTAQPDDAKDTAKSQGANVSLEALTSASRLVSSPPSGMSADSWFSGISPQLFALLDGEGGLEMVKAAAFIIGYGVLGRREYGAPGTAGWKAFAEPLICSINPSLRTQSERSSSVDQEGVVKLTASNVLVSAEQLAGSLRRLASFLSSHPNPSLSKRLLGNILLPLWCLFSWPATGTQFEDWRAPAGYLLQIYLQLSDNTKLFTIMNHITINGSQTPGRTQWQYKADGEGIRIESLTLNTMISSPSGVSDIELIASKVESFIALLQQIKDGESVSAIFIELCKKWLSSATLSPRPTIITVNTTSNDDGEDTTETRLIEGMIIQKLMDSSPDKLIEDSAQVLELTNGVLLSALQQPKLDEDTVGIALSLLNLCFTSPNFNQSNHVSTLPSLQGSLRRLAMSQNEIAATARNLSYLLEFQQTHPDDEVKPILADPNEEDRRQHKLAMSYLMSSESPPPVRAQGLDLITSLITKNSPILDVPSTLILLTSLLQDEEEYIYLRSIKTLTLLSSKHPKAVSNSLTDQYIDPNEEHSLDSRLRIGEALSQIIEKAGQTFTGSAAQTIGQGLLSIAGRRGIRAKTKERQQKAEKLSKAKNLDFKTAWDSLEIEQDEPENEVLAQIVEGWEGKRGEEDVRIRASALSIFGSAIEVNVSGVGSSIVSDGVDLSVNILAMEPEPEKAVLRRSAILLVMSLVRALDNATSNPGFGFAGQSLDAVVRVLKYVMETDNDGIVRGHAAVVIEGLETWQLKGLLGAKEVQRTSLAEGGLAGLSLSADSGSRGRSRIEEIE